MAPVVILRKAEAADASLILELIHALAAYEREPPSTVQATVETLTATLFPSSGTPYARVILAFTPENEPAGMALYFNNYSTWRAAPGVYLEDLFVYEKFRNRGYGKALLAALAQETQRIGGKRLEWSVLKWNEPSIKFYESIGAQNLGLEWQVMRVTDEALVKLAERGPEVKWE
ncbi:acyl-CoA N-acyltransferase [Pyronema domesticum]|uniref:Similar to N-acetyltransferase ats1 acc. no. P79081 n=1 Tax=Pyronema omphalodes (strain CBS 100304) TaxID=1076935 RepID=U4L7A1_PYROM|nr:acyl-CoA N-acyltransferase [Pyronema domesticum]CCX12360.1 Similar to N-acetyltransferase ats1; acc. no. P79081 [Pyronema omphalodes CBS 100304]